MKTYGLKYCGGCKSQYDRAIAAELLAFENVSIAQPGIHYDTVAVICGCPSCCVNISALSADSFLFLYNKAQIMDLYNQLKDS